MSTVTAWLAFGAVVLGFLTAVMAYLNQIRTQKAMVIVKQTAAVAQEISVQVDGRMSALIEALHASTPVPTRPPESTPQ